MQLVLRPLYAVFSVTFSFRLNLQADFKQKRSGLDCVTLIIHFYEGVNIFQRMPNIQM
jgi:hypothetical protein